MMRLKIPSLITMSKTRAANLGFTLLSTLLTVGALGYLVYRERATLLDHVWRIYPAPLLLAILIYALDVMWAAVLWGSILNRLGCRIKFLQHYRFYCLSHLAKRIPGTLWYIANRATLYSESGVDMKLTTAASGMEFALILISAACTTLVFSLPILAAHHVPTWVIGLVFLAALLCIHPRVMRYLFGLLNVEASSFDFKDLLRWTIGYIVMWLLGGVMFYFMASIYYPLPWQAVSYIVGAWSLVGLVSYLLLLSPTNFGVTEIGLSLLLTSIMPAPVAVVAAVTSRILTTLVDLLMGIAWVAINQRWPSLTRKY
jgi:glycosyltransferase 2 family protein